MQYYILNSVMEQTIVIVNYGMGNLHSILKNVNKINGNVIKM